MATFTRFAAAVLIIGGGVAALVGYPLAIICCITGEPELGLVGALMAAAGSLAIVAATNLDGGLS